MKFRTGLKVLFLSGIVTYPVWAADLSSAVLSPGKYQANVMPVFNADMASRLDEAIKAIDGLTDVDIKASDSSIHFTVKDGSRVKIEKIQKVVARVDSGAVITTPLLEKSLTTNPGL